MFDVTVGSRDQGIKRRRWCAPAVSAKRLVLAVVGALCATDGASSQVPCYEVVQIIQGPTCQFTGPIGVFATDISPNGRYVCGYYPHCDVAGNKAFVFDTQTQQFTTLPIPPGISTVTARGVNDTPWVVGHMGGNIGDFGFVFDLTGGQYLAQIPAVKTTGGNGAALNAINAQGVACGTRTVSLNPTLDNAFLWSAKAGIVDLGLVAGESTTASDINDNLWLTGTFIENGTTTGFLWRGKEFISIGTLAGLQTVPFALNNRNEVVGRSHVPHPGFPFGVAHAFLWNGIALLDLGTLPGDNVSNASDISQAGFATGVSNSTSQPNLRSFIRVDGQLQAFENFVVNAAEFGISKFSEIGGISHTGIVAESVRKEGREVVAVLVPVLPSVGDIDANCRVNIDDLLKVINDWGQTDSIADGNQDGIVGVDDLMLVIENWTPS